MEPINIGHVLRMDHGTPVTASFTKYGDEIQSGDVLRMESGQIFHTGPVNVLESRPAHGTWKGTPPTWYKVELLPQVR